MFHVKHAEFTKPKLFVKVVNVKERRRVCNAKRKTKRKNRMFHVKQS